jgi:gluconolactonase
MEAAQFDADVDELDKAIVPIVGPIEPKLYKLADGFRFNGGAVWSSEGYLLLADMEANTIYKYSPKETSISVFRNPSDNSGPGLGESSQPRPNGLAFDPQGQLTIAQEGNRRVIRLGKDGSVTVLAESYQNKPLNGPHGLVYRSDGTLYFTDPRSGMPKWFNGQPPDLPYSGVYSIYKGKLQLVSKDPKTPFGIALSPDEKHLYVVDHSRWIVMRYEANADGTLSNGKVFFDMTSLRGGGYACGIAVDQQGNVFVTGRGGVQVISSEGKLLGTINAPNKPRDLAWDGNTLYLSSPDALYFMWMGFPGVRPVGKQP